MMKDWLLSVASVIILIEIICIILPDGKLNKYIKSTLSLLVVFVVLQPIINLKNNSDNLNLFDGEYVYEISMQDEYLNYSAQKRVSILEKNVIMIMENNDIYDASACIKYSYDAINDIVIEKVEINLTNAVIKSDDKHINIIEETKEDVSKFLAVDKGVIVVSE